MSRIGRRPSPPTHAQISEQAAEYLGRPVPVEFVRAVLDGDPFIYDRARERDRQAVAVILALSRGVALPARKEAER